MKKLLILLLVVSSFTFVSCKKKEKETKKDEPVSFEVKTITENDKNGKHIVAYFSKEIRKTTDAIYIIPDAISENSFIHLLISKYHSLYRFCCTYFIYS